MATVTHFPPGGDALRAGDGESIRKTETRACNGCGREFQITRPWQKQCSQRCRQRTYRTRQAIPTPGYYGA